MPRAASHCQPLPYRAASSHRPSAVLPSYHMTRICTSLPHKDRTLPPWRSACDGLSVSSRRKTECNIRIGDFSRDAPHISTNIPESRFGYRQLSGSPFSLATLETSRLHQKRHVGGAISRFCRFRDGADVLFPNCGIGNSGRIIRKFGALTWIIHKHPQGAV